MNEPTPDLLAKYRGADESPGPCATLGEEPTMLRLQTQAGSLWAFPYGSLRSLRCKGNTSVVIDFGSHTVRLTGMRLAPVYDALCRRAVDLLRTEPDSGRDESDGAPVVDSVRVYDHQMSEVTD